MSLIRVEARRGQHMRHFHLDGGVRPDVRLGREAAKNALGMLDASDPIWSMMSMEWGTVWRTGQFSLSKTQLSSGDLGTLRLANHVAHQTACCWVVWNSFTCAEFFSSCFLPVPAAGWLWGKGETGLQQESPSCCELVLPNDTAR
jgi:hypothetical protein